MGSQDAFELALGALRRRERSVAELSGWLRERDVGPDDVEAVIARLVEDGVLDDERFARRFAEDKRELAGWGAERIREALVGRGISPEYVEAAVAGDSDGIQVRRASDLLARRARRLDSEADKASALGFLTRRGYSFEIAHEAIRLGSRTDAHG